MGKNPEQEIQQKLIELELAMEEAEARRQPPSVVSKGKQLSRKQKSVSKDTELTQLDGDETVDSLPAKQSFEAAAMSADLHTFGGIALCGLSILFLCTHVHVMAGVGFSIFGGSRMYMGMFLIPIFIGISMLFYNFRSRVAQIVTAGSIGLLLFMVLMQLQMTFAPLSLLELMMMILPVCAGMSFLLKGHYKRLALKRDQSD
jgi:hypothetical protein